MDTWIDNTSYAQWKKGCKRKLSKSKQGSRAWKAACIIMPVLADERAFSCATEPSDWVDPPMAPPTLFAYERIDHRHTIYRQIRILSWHISIEHSNPCI
jgi:hypothetical protein